MTTKKLSENETEEILNILKVRIKKNRFNLKNLDWEEIEKRLIANPEKLWSLEQMEKTGGEPDVIKIGSAIVFCDCSKESPSGRRSLCYDHEALLARKENKPQDSAVNAAQEMGIELLDEDQYRHLQTLDKFDEKTSSWIKTPSEIRKLGGSLFCDRRYDFVFLYHNGVQSYYAARGFRGLVKI
ncbi:DUF4256 domain-containing protein [Chryseobacterium caseinilyticum]|uniref:DUF4256 domain-containing protein n=1 Tax=Chryseobacterium caseinilyticum TaxID=2771428 RepID=A0ABR8ZB65_9FLAO|nr:DUF4256 domain-containing protein [Chryseobacterium caseinilyticum]MBD8082532.1 DUF4256 domain-containing protein [Chryseobacterium caseinilyticum]